MPATLSRFTIITQVTGAAPAPVLHTIVAAAKPSAVREAIAGHRRRLVDAGDVQATRRAIHVVVCREAPNTAPAAPVLVS